VPSETAAYGCKIKEVAVIHEIGEEGSSIMVKDVSSLIAREKSFIEISYEHPRDVKGLANSHKVIPEVGALDMVGAGIDTSAVCGYIPTAQ
jgi:hypothetical protein